MKARFILLAIGLAFAITLAIIVGQRLSSEAMAVTVGVVAGVAASIPTSLIVVWFATRTVMTARERPAPVTAPTAPPEPRIVVMPQAMMPAGYQNFAGFTAPNFNTAAYQPIPMPQGLAQRQFSVIGGSEMGEPENQPAEVIWPR